jgi:hypothetical protein
MYKRQICRGDRGKGNHDEGVDAALAAALELLENSIINQLEIHKCPNQLFDRDSSAVSPSET